MAEADSRPLIGEPAGKRGGPAIEGSGLTSQRDANLSGAIVAGRDIHVSLAPASTAMDLFQLPPDIDDFTGREGPLHQIMDVMQRPSTVVISAIAGKAGVGKTALAVRAAHQLRDQFPDGQLYVNLRGAEAQRLEPFDVLAEFLRTLGVDDAAIPEHLDERVRRYRARLSDRKILVVLDNAAGEAQVRPLLPGSRGNGVLITSRSRLAGLEAAHTINLEVLDPGQALELFGRVAGVERTLDEPEAARSVVKLCGYLPLAVRIASARLAARRHWSVAMLARRLSNEHVRLEELQVGDLEVRASFALSYSDLTQVKQRLFRLLGLLKALDFPAWVAASLLECEPFDAEEVVEQLVDAQVLEVAGVSPTGELRYQFHDLLRIFARERLQAEEPKAAQRSALKRVLETYLELAEQASARVAPAGVHDGARRPIRHPGLAATVLHEPEAWLAAERTGLVAAVQQAHEAKLWGVTCRLANAPAYFFNLRNHWSDWQQTQELALDASRRARKGSWEAQALRQLGAAYREQDCLEAAQSCFEQSLAIFRKLEDLSGQAWATLGLGEIATDENRYADALAHFEACMPAFVHFGDRRGEAWTRLHLGVVHRFQGRYDEAAASFEGATSLFEESRERAGKAMTLLNVGMVEHARGRLDQALGCYDRCLPMLDELGDRRTKAYALNRIGDIHREQGRLEEARIRLNQSLDSFRDLELRDGEAWTLFNLGLLHTAQQQFEHAMTLFDRCLKLVRELGDTQMEARALVAVGDVRQAQGHPAEALACFDRALPELRRLEDLLWEARAQRGRGAALAASGDQAAARAAWRRAAAIRRSLGLPADADADVGA